MVAGVQSESSVTTDVHIVLLKKDDDHSWKYVPILCERIRRFCLKYHSDADPDKFTAMYQHNFLEDDPRVIGVVAIKEDRIIGHILVSFDQWMGERFGTTLQYEYDEPIAEELRTRADEWLCRWAKTRGAAHMQALTRDKAHARAFAQHYGYSPYAIILRKSLKDM